MPRQDRSSSRLLAALGAGACVFLSACDDADPAEAAIDDAAIEIRSLNPTGGLAPSAEARKEHYQAALAALRSPGAESTDAQQTSILLLTSEAEAGLAQIPLDNAQAIERRLLGNMREARALLSQWRSHKIREASARRYDPQPELEEIAEKIAERDAEIAEAEAAKAAIDDQIATLRDEVAEKQAEVDREREIEAELRERSRATSAVEGAELIQEARTHQRLADALEVEIERLQVRIDQAERRAEEAQLEIDRLRTQRELLSRARMDVESRATASQEQAAEAADDAEVSAERLATAVAAIRETRADGAALAQAYDESISGYQRALNAVNRAQSDQRIRATAKSKIGLLQQSLGDAHFARARGIEIYIELLDALIAEGGELPGSAADLQGAREEALAAKQEHERLAREAYQTAKSAYASSGIRDEDTRQRIERINTLFDKLAPENDGPAQPQDTGAQQPAQPQNAPAAGNGDG